MALSDWHTIRGQPDESRPMSNHMLPGTATVVADVTMREQNAAWNKFADSSQPR